MLLGRGCWAWVAYGLLFSAPTLAVADPQKFDIPAQPLPAALKAFAAQTHIQLFYVYSVVANTRGNAVQGELDTRQALAALLRNTGLEAVYSSDTEVTIRHSPGPQDAGDPTGASGSERSGAKSPEKTPHLGQNGAQPPVDSSANGAQLEEVIVTSQKREERLQDVPIPVTAITAATLADENRSSLQDYYSQVPGLSLTPNEFGGAPTIAIRGITSGDFTNPTVGITVDDVPFGPSTVIGGGYFAPDLDPSDLARIEVLRGPQGTLYGASSMGGLLKYVTADPSTTALSGRLQAGLATVHNGPGVGYNVSGAINIPLGDTFAVRASGFTREEPGYVDNIRADERGVNKVESVGAHVSALWRPSTLFSVKLSALVQNNKLFGSPYVTVAPGLGDLQQDFLPQTGGVDRKLQAYSATVTAKLGTFDLTSVTGYSVSRLRDALDYTQILGALTFPPFQTFDTVNTDDTHTNKVSQEIRLSTPLGTHFDWLVGGFYTHESSPWTIELIPVSPSSQRLGSLALVQFNSVYAEVAAFTDLTWHITDTFDIQLGGRQSQIRQTFAETDNGIYVPLYENPSSPALTLVTPERATREHAFTYLVTPSWKVSPDLMLYMRFASGFRPGGINQGNLTGLPADFQPDKTRTYELGAKGSAFDRRLSFEASVYYIDWKQIQLSFLNQENGQNYFANGSEAKSQGVELSAQLTPVKGLHLGGWVSWNDAALTQDLPANSTGFGLSGERLPYSSRFSASGSLDYDFPLGRLTGGVGGALSYVGNRIGAFQAAPERQDLPGYAKTDLHASVRSVQWTLDLYVNNVLDRRGIVGGGLGTAVPTAFGVIQPRTAGFSVAWTY